MRLVVRLVVRLFDRLFVADQVDHIGGGKYESRRRVGQTSRRGCSLLRLTLLRRGGTRARRAGGGAAAGHLTLTLTIRLPLPLPLILILILVPTLPVAPQPSPKPNQEPSERPAACDDGGGWAGAGGEEASRAQGEAGGTYEERAAARRCDFAVLASVDTQTVVSAYLSWFGLGLGLALTLTLSPTQTLTRSSQPT